MPHTPLMDRPLGFAARPQVALLPGGPVRGSGGRSVRRTVDPMDVARRLAPALHWPGALDLTTRSWRRVAATADFDAWLIAWPQGGRVELHDHGASVGALAVLEGSLVETVPWRDDTGRLVLQGRTLHAGATLSMPAGHVHDVVNDAQGNALSLHVYSPPLRTMTDYAIAGDQLVVQAVRPADEVDER